MCGFVVVNQGMPIEDRFIRRRGPDAMTSLTRGGLEFRHYLLHVTGERLLQPFSRGDVVCVFNGEIYNQPFRQSDGEVLIPLYERYGIDFVSHLDGEFAIALYDFARELVIFATDPFGTKPLFARGLECASYRSAVAGERIPHNSTVVRYFDRSKPDLHIENAAFDYSNQSKESYDDWISAFSRAVAKRATNGCFVSLSSGYDSGAVACELLKQNVSFHSYSIRADEPMGVLESRIARTRGTLFHLSLDDYARQTQLLQEECEWANLRKEADLRLHCEFLFQDPGAVGGSFIFSHARANGRIVHLSGHGGDEVTSDYGHMPHLTSLHGGFPRHLRPWRNLFGGCMRAYLTKEEYVAGAHGLETRYPLLDRDLVQEFLWLSPELKNRHYKAPLHEYLSRNEFPFQEGLKVGFCSHLNLRRDPTDPRMGNLFSWTPFGVGHTNTGTTIRPNPSRGERER
jgi:asparagine synthetase B (glutamine-hydrolysing)